MQIAITWSDGTAAKLTLTDKQEATVRNAEQQTEAGIELDACELEFYVEPLQPNFVTTPSAAWTMANKRSKSALARE